MADVIPKEILEAMQGFCLATESDDALWIAEQMMNDSRVRMHGPEHHFLAAAAVLTAYCNKYRPKEKYKFLQMAKSRTARIPVGMCALYGTCGAMMGAGAAVSIIVSANPFDRDPLVTVNEVTSVIQREIASYKGIRCCKRVTWASVIGAVAGLNRAAGTELPLPSVVCPFSGANDSCIAEACRYFR